MSLCWMYWINADSQWQGVSIKLSTSAGFCDIFSPRLAMDLPMVGLQRSCSLDGALSLELILGTKAAMSRGMMCGTRWRSWPTSTDPRCFTTWQIWWRRTQNRIVACIRLKSLSSSFSLNLFVNSIHLPMSMTFNEQQRPVLEAFQAVSQRIANNHHAFCAWPWCLQ